MPNTEPAATNFQGVTTAAHLLGDGVAPDLAQVLGELHDPVVFLSPDWRITYFNQTAAGLSRLKPTDLNGPTTWELFPDVIGTELERKYRRAMRERVEERLLLDYPRFGLWLDLRIIPISTGLAILYRDVTEQRRQEEQRIATQRQLEQVLEVTTDSIVSVDRSWKITFMNRQAKQMLAASGDVLGKNLWECFPDAFAEGSPFRENYCRTMEKGEATSFECYYPEPLNMWLALNAQPTADGIIVFSRDVTLERRSQEAVRLKQLETERQRAELEAVYRTAPIGLALFDPVEFRYLRLNDRQAEFFGLRPEQIVGKTLTEMAPIAGLREMFEQVARGEPVRDRILEGELATRPGEHRYWTVNYYPVYASDGSVQAISAVSQEITRQKRAEAALIQSEKLAAVGRLATSISHEINNPLEAVTNILYLLATDESLPESLRSYVDTAQAEVARVSQIATQTLRFHRQSARPTSVDAALLVSPVLDLYQGRLVNSGIEVDACYASRTPFLCFENDMRQVLNNLIANAIDAMRSGGRLIVRAHDTTTQQEPGQPGVRITIADTGHGMSAATLARIFEPFYTTKDLNGTGLGLWISAEIIARHGGRLTVRSSQAPTHRGTVFSLFLPLSGE